MSLHGLARQWVLPFIDPRRLWALVRIPGFLMEWRTFRRSHGPMSAPFADLYPCLDDRTGTTPFDAHYFYQAAWLARCLATVRPDLHADVGSSVNMLSAISAWQPTVFLDYRPLQVKLSGLACVAGTITALPFGDRAVSSLSCLHVIEHIGLGRYGDPLDADGSLKACAELQRVLAPDGRLYLSVPVGRERVCFNAHRVFSPQSIVDALPYLHLLGFSLIRDDGVFVADASFAMACEQEYGCGLFEFTLKNA
jgi:SAM-dependent methyltransferase